MMREKLHIALVVSKDDKVLGLITLEDIIEEFVGDIEDEEDSLPTHMHPTAGGWLMGGGVPMNAISSRIGVPWSATFAHEHTLRLADWCVSVLKRPLKKARPSAPKACRSRCANSAVTNSPKPSSAKKPPLPISFPLIACP